MGGSESTQNSGNRDDNIDGDEVRTKNRDGAKKVAAVVLGAIAVAAAAVVLGATAVGLIGSAFGSDSDSDSEESRKTMKAPGRDGRIFRDVFEADPGDYFRNLRK